jgi:general secretion pathway protein C
MNKFFNESSLQRFNKLAFPLVFLWSISLFGAIFLPTCTYERFTYPFEPFFEIFHFGEKLALSDLTSAVHTKTVTLTTLVPYPHRIKGIYRSQTGSFASIYDGKETLIVPLKGTYKGVFRLIGLNDTSAIFQGYGKTYRLRLGKDDNLSRWERLTRSVSTSLEKTAKENLPHAIAYQRVMKQVHDVQNIHKSIDISESRNGSKFMGYRINTIAPDSIFSQLGLQKGDIIYAVNNQKLESFGDVLMIYGRIPQLRSIRLTVQRNNLPKDIVYEIIR